MAEGGRQVSKLDCCICLSAFRDPKLLPCFHTFCLQCLDEYVLRNGKDGEFDCPLCHVCIDIPEGGVKSFQYNFYIHGGYISDQETDCDVCGEGHEATHYCTDCEQNFCERCTTSHMKIRMTREHVLIQLKDVNEKDKTHFPKIHKKYFCLQHKGEEIKMVCKDCDTKLCVVCKLTEHENHNTSSIAKEAEKRRASLSDTISLVNSELEKLKSNEGKANNYAVEMENKLKINISLLENRTDSLVAKVKAHSENIKKELINRYTKAKQYYLEKGTQIQQNVLESATLINHSKNVVDFGDDSEVIDVNLISKLKSLSSSEDCSIQRQEYFAFETSSVEVTDEMLGKISSVYPEVTVTELNEIHAMTSTSGTEQANAFSISADRFYASFSDYRRFLWQEIHTSRSNFTDKFYDTGQCGGLTSIGTDLHFTSLNDKTIYKLKAPEHTKRKFYTLKDYPHGIAHRITYIGNDSEQELLVCCLKSGEVLGKAKCEGSVIAISLSNKQHYTWRDKEIPGPACIAVDKHTGNVCLGYPAGHKVTLNAADGTVLAVYSGLGCHGNPERFCPISVCFDNYFGIIIADNENGFVIRIDKFCNFLQCLVKRKTPQSVLLGDGNILLVGYKGKEITKYQLKPFI